jgi:replicative DNA helicase
MTRFSSLAEAARESERVVLGTLARSPERFPEVPLSGPDWGLSSHRIIHGAMASLAEQGRTWDLSVIAEVLKDRGQLRDVGGMAELCRLTEDLPWQLALDEHITRIRDARRRRELWTQGARICRLAEDRGADPADVLRDLRREIEGLEQTIPANGHVPNSFWAAESMAELLASDDAASEWLIPR